MARRAALLIVVGASGSGKSTLFPLLVERLRGVCMVFDVDWLIDPLNVQQNGAWDRFRDAWLHIAHGVAQNGLPTLLLAPFIPEHLEQLPGRQWVDEIDYLVLDCSDEERRRRIEARPPWRARDVAEQNEFGRWLRANLAPVIDTQALTVDETADAVVGWAREIAARSGGVRRG